MGIEFGSALGNIATGISRGVSGVGNVATAVSRGPAIFGAQLEAPLGAMVREGPVASLAGLRPIAVGIGARVETQGFLPGFRPMGVPDIKTPDAGGGRIGFRIKPIQPELKASMVVKEAEAIVSQAQKPLQEGAILAEANHWLGLDKPKIKVEPVTNSAFTVIPRERSDRGNPDSIGIASPVEDSLLAMTTTSLPRVTIAPALEPKEETETGIQVVSLPKTETQVASKTAQSVSVKPALQEEEAVKTKEKVRTGFDQEQQKVDTIELEEVEESELVDIVDEEVLSKRSNEFSQAVNLAGEEAQNQGLLEINGRRIGELVPQETEDSRSGIIKKHGPDGSRVEIIEEIRRQRFRSIAGAKKQIAQTISRKVPVKKGKEGRRVGHEAVARVLKYLLIKYQPAREVATRAIKKVRVDRGK